MTCIPLLMLGGLELAFRLANVGESRSFFLDGTEVEMRKTWIDNQDFARWFFPVGLEPYPRPIPFAIDQTKSAETCRIMVLGESAAMGFPEPSVNFARILELMLRERYPQRRIEFVNTAFVAINSHVARQIALQGVRHDPDLLIVHLGNNEVMGPFGAAGVLGPFSPSLGLIRASLALKASRLGQSLGTLATWLSPRPKAGQSWKGMASFVGCNVAADDPRLARIRSHFQRNLQDICRAATARGIPVVLCTIPVNLRDSAPFGSQHAAGLDDRQLQEWQQHYAAGIEAAQQGELAKAAERFDAAAQLDSQFADLQYRLGRCWWTLGDAERARQHLERACNLDTLRFRTDAGMNQVIREVATENRSKPMQLADAVQSFAQRSPGEIPGAEWFLEHVHMTFDGNYLLAETVFQAIERLALPALGPPDQAAALPSNPQCRARLAYTARSELKICTTIGEMYEQLPPFTFQLDNEEQVASWQAKRQALQQQLQSGGLQQSLLICQNAVAENDDDWMLHQKLGEMWGESGNPARALQEYQRVTELMRHVGTPYFMMGQMEFALKRFDVAMAHYWRAIDLDPKTIEAYIRLAEILQRQGKSAEVQAVLDALLQQNPGRGYAFFAIGNFHLQSQRFEEAYRWFTQAAELEPGNFEAQYFLGLTAGQLGQRADAIRHFETALEIQPRNETVRAQLEKWRSPTGNDPSQAPPPGPPPPESGAPQPN